MANKPSKYLPAQSNNSNTTKNVLNTAKVNNNVFIVDLYFYTFF